MNWKLESLLRQLHTVNDNEYESIMYAAAEELMNKHIVRTDLHDFRLTEIEFYLYVPAVHEDVNTHCAPPQLQFGRWYYNGFGLDISFGNSPNRISGGVLIRGLCQYGRANLERQNILGSDSPFENRLGEILRVLLVNSGEIGAPKKMDLIEYEDYEKTKILSTPRINLRYLNVFGEAKYRFISHLVKKHKFPGRDVVRKMLSGADLERFDR